MAGADVQTALPTRMQLPQIPSGTPPPLNSYVEELHRTLDRMWALLVVAISDRHGAGLLANRPVPGVAGRFYLCTDVPKLSVDTGAAWLDIAIP